MMAAYMLPEGHHAPEEPPFYLTTYERILAAALRHRGATVFMAVVVFFASLGLAPFIPKGLFSNGDMGEVVVQANLPEGSTLEDTTAVVDRISAMLKSRPEEGHIFATAGSTGGAKWDSAGGASVAQATINVLLVPKHERKLSPELFAAEMSPILKQVPGARISVTALGGVGGGKAINLVMRGSDPEALDKFAPVLLAQMRGLTELRDVTSSAADLRPELVIKPDFARAAEQGVNVATIGRMARIATQGDVDFNLPKFNAGDQQINMRVQLAENARQDLQSVGNLKVPGRQGLIPLNTVASLSFSTGPVQLARYDRARQITFSANTAGGVPLGDAMAKINQLPAMRALPPGVTQDNLGQAKIMADIFGGFMFAFGAGTLFIYAVLVLLFGSFLQPLTIMAALPLSIGGAMAGLLVGGKELGMMGLIGILMLMGLVTKNSILLVEYAIMARSHGLPRTEALMKAGQDRLRPILMTTIAMIAGMLPIALEFGEGTERLSPMAAAVIGGLITSTLLTLVVVPATYTYVDDFQEFVRRTIRRLSGGRINATPSHERVHGEGVATH
jgi:multidrug efflux pump subunit AcrB